MENLTSPIGKLQNHVGQYIFGQEELIENMLCCVLAEGHVLLTGVPGLAKTSLIKVLAGALRLDFSRIQFTPDLLPSDITGAEVLQFDGESKRDFVFQKGPVFTNLLLADEINRASPRTQSALLEAMQENSVTVGGKKHSISRPFLVLATQNPIESEGTFPLPEAQLDRFMMHLVLDYPDAGSELKVLQAHAENSLVGEIKDKVIESSSLIQQGTFLETLQAVKDVKVGGEVLEIINTLVRSTRPTDELCSDDLRSKVAYGAGPRAGIALISCSKAYAFMHGKGEVDWSDVKRIFVPVMRHRLKLKLQYSFDVSIESILANLVGQVESRYKGLALGDGK